MAKSRVAKPEQANMAMAIKDGAGLKLQPGRH